MAPPFRQAEFDIIYNEGISRGGSDRPGLMRESSRRASWYSYGDERIGQGREKALKENPDVCARLAEEVYLAKDLGLAVPAKGPEEATEDATTSAAGSGRPTRPDVRETGPWAAFGLKAIQRWRAF